jgi:glyoxylase-like metal-dependent hydrolase (beta-lactamase superfamily II)
MALSINVLNSGYKPIPPAPGWDTRHQATWPATTATLIAGDRDAILVDAMLTLDEGDRLAAWARKLGAQPRAVYLTHGHGDHFFGAGPVLDAFPGSRLIAADQQIADEARDQTGPASMARWNAQFPGQIAADPAVPVVAAPGDFELDGHPIDYRAIGGADGVLASFVHVPDQRIVCSGDIAYNNIHMWLWRSTPESRKAWLASLDAIAAVDPVTIITGHKDPDAPDDDAARVLDQSRRYLEDFDQVVAAAGSSAEVFDKMLAKYPAYGNRHTLFMAAGSQFPS